MNLIQGTTGHDELSGTTGDDRIYGYGGDDILRGGGGSDSISAGGGDDSVIMPWTSFSLPSRSVVDGGAGNDILTLQVDFGVITPTLDLTRVTGFEQINLVDGISVALANANATAGSHLHVVNGDVDASAVTAFHLFYMGFSYDVLPIETVVGTALSDFIFGRGVLSGGGGDDELWAKEGGSTLSGGDGNDNLSASEFGTTIMDGGAGNDGLFGGQDASDLTVASGGSGNDYFQEGPGTDTFDGGAGVDTVTYQSATSAVHVSLATIGPQITGDGTDTLTGIEKVVGSNFSDTLVAGAGGSALNGAGGNDVLIGGPGADVLNGASGNDRLTGGAGPDLMTGLSGSDVFAFVAMSDSAHDAPDTITDFTSGVDKIDLSAIDADTGRSGHQHFHVGGGGGHAGDITATYNQLADQTLIELWTGAHVPVDGAILLQGEFDLTLSSADFVL